MWLATDEAGYLWMRLAQTVRAGLVRYGWFLDRGLSWFYLLLLITGNSMTLIYIGQITKSYCSGGNHFINNRHYCNNWPLITEITTYTE